MHLVLARFPLAKVQSTDSFSFSVPPTKLQKQYNGITKNISVGNIVFNLSLISKYIMEE